MQETGDTAGKGAKERTRLAKGEAGENQREITGNGAQDYGKRGDLGAKFGRESTEKRGENASIFRNLARKTPPPAGRDALWAERTAKRRAGGDERRAEGGQRGGQRGSGGPDSGSRWCDGAPPSGLTVPRNLALRDGTPAPPPASRCIASAPIPRDDGFLRRRETARAGGWRAWRDGRDWRDGRGCEITEKWGILGRNSGARPRRNGAKMRAFSVISHGKCSAERMVGRGGGPTRHVLQEGRLPPPRDEPFHQKKQKSRRRGQPARCPRRFAR